MDPEGQNNDRTTIYIGILKCKMSIWDIIHMFHLYVDHSYEPLHVNIGVWNSYYVESPEETIWWSFKGVQHP